MSGATYRYIVERSLGELQLCTTVSKEVIDAYSIGMENILFFGALRMLLVLPCLQHRRPAQPSVRVRLFWILL